MATRCTPDRWFARSLLTLLILGALVAPARSADLRCAVCQERLAGEFVWISSPALADKQSVCNPCSKLEARCDICTLPVNHQGRRLADGRFLCPHDFRVSVFDEREALRVYEETRRELQGILSGFGVLPGVNIKVTLVDGTRLKQLNQSLPSAHDDTQKLRGLTRSRVRNKTEFEHDIFLINGMAPARLAAVAAHEYTHAWIHENVPSTRQLERDSIEGFCELVAYKLMSRRGEETEKKVILANAYTRGQVNAFVQAEQAHQFHRVIKWMKTGVDDALIASNATQVLVVAQEPSAPVWPPPKALSTAVPDRLELRGLSGPPGRRFALVNDATLAKGDNARIRVAQTTVQARCLEIREASVILQVDGRTDPLELFLKSAPSGRNLARE